MKIKIVRRMIRRLLVCTLIVGFVWQSVRVKNEKAMYVPQGEYVDLKAYQAHVYSKGQGDVTICFISGSGTPCAYTDFFMLQNKLTDRGQTITFDHAGSGWSDGTQMPRTIDNLVGELSELLDTIAPDKSVIFICHSLGSLEAIGYAQMNPEKVKGIVFMDSGSPEFYSTDSELLAKAMNRGIAFIRSFGIARLLGNLGILLPVYGEDDRNAKLSGMMKELDKAMYYRYAGNSSTLSNIKWMNENAKQVLEGPHLEDTPILVLSSDSGEEWNGVQTELLSWSNNSVQIKLKDSRHYLHWSNEDVVEACINEFIEDILYR